MRQRMDGKDENNQRQKATLLDYKGRIYVQMGEPELAMSYFRDALAIAEKTQYHLIRAYTLNDLGALLLRQHKAGTAEKYHQQALDILNEHESEDSRGIAETKALLADAELASGKTDAANQNYQTALLLQEKSDDAIGQAQTHFSLGLKEFACQLDNALQSLQTAAEIYRRFHERGRANPTQDSRSPEFTPGSCMMPKRKQNWRLQYALPKKSGISLPASNYGLPISFRWKRCTGLESI